MNQIRWRVRWIWFISRFACEWESGRKPRRLLKDFLRTECRTCFAQPNKHSLVLFQSFRFSPCGSVQKYASLFLWRCWKLVYAIFRQNSWMAVTQIWVTATAIGICWCLDCSIIRNILPALQTQKSRIPICFTYAYGIRRCRDSSWFLYTFFV